jgi:replicative DNA helicase
VITVFEALTNIGKADDVGGLQYLNAMAQNTPSAANIRRYAEIVRDRGVLRKLITVADEISGQAFTRRARKSSRCSTRPSRRFSPSPSRARAAPQGWVRCSRC